MLPEVVKLASTPRSVIRRLTGAASMPRQNPPDNPNHPARLSLISRHLAPVYPINQNTPCAIPSQPLTTTTPSNKTV